LDKREQEEEIQAGGQKKRSSVVTKQGARLMRKPLFVAMALATLGVGTAVVDGEMLTQVRTPLEGEFAIEIDPFQEFTTDCYPDKVYLSGFWHDVISQVTNRDGSVKWRWRANEHVKVLTGQGGEFLGVANRTVQQDWRGAPTDEQGYPTGDFVWVIRDNTRIVMKDGWRDMWLHFEQRMSVTNGQFAFDLEVLKLECR
jgi:hypothetical protein